MSHSNDITVRGLEREFKGGIRPFGG